MSRAQNGCGACNNSIRILLMNSTSVVVPPRPSLHNSRQSQRERLAYIDFRLYFLGDIRRQDLTQRFGIAPAVATRDFAKYKEQFPANIRLNSKSKSYVIGEEFLPAFEHESYRVLTALTQGYGEGTSPSGGSLILCELPLVLSHPSTIILAPISRAIHQSKAVRLSYHSYSSGKSTREIVPFALVNDGLRWHVRAFNRKDKDFRDFVLTRMSDTSVIEDGLIEKHELSSEDDQWNRIVELELVPHPKLKNPEIVKGDFGMVDGVLKVRTRAAVAGYVLLYWMVDCTVDHSLEGQEYRLWLRNPLALYGVSSSLWAPGYKAPR